MTTSYLKKEKNTRKYCSISRATQAEALDEIEITGQSQRKLAEKYAVPRTTLQHWINRKNELKGKIDPKVVEFFESSSGQAWLHKMMLSTFLIFHHNGNSGIPDLHEYFEMVEINKFVGTSITSLQKVGKKIDKKIDTFGKKETGRLAKDMSPKSITGALDENFIMDEMTLILMDPVAGFILAEQIEEKRDADTWYRVTQKALEGLNVTIQQLVGDEASGLTKLATKSLKVIKGPDLFHVQQEITWGLTSHLARTLRQVKKKQEDLQKKKQEVLEKFGDHLKKVNGIQELSKRGINAGQRILEIENEAAANQKKIEVTENRYERAQEARRNISHAYHPFSLDTGEKQSPDTVKIKIKNSYETLDSIAQEAECTDKQKKKLEKSKRTLESMIEVLKFFFSYLALTIKSMGLDASNQKLFEHLVSIKYLNTTLKRTRKKREKEKIKATLSRLEQELEKNPLWREIGKAVQKEWWRRASECAQVFQRSSSCVEGRNGQLSLKFHAFRRVNKQTLRVLTVLHNFFIKRKDGTTAAERFFAQEPRDLFQWLLGKVELPRPRKKHRRRVKLESKKLVA